MRQEFNAKATSIICDATWNGFMYKPGASQIMDQYASMGAGDTTVIAALINQMEAGRDHCKTINRFFGGGFLALNLGMALVSGGVGFIGAAFIVFNSFLLASSFEKIGPMKNPIAFGLDPSKDYDRAAKTVERHYHKRFK